MNNDRRNTVIGLAIALVVFIGFIWGISSPESLIRAQIAAAPVWFKLIGAVLLGGAVFLFIKLMKGDIEGIGWLIALGALLVLSLASFMGFGNYIL